MKDTIRLKNFINPTTRHDIVTRNLFISGYILIALEHQTGISKSAIALLLGILLWTFIPHTDNEIINHLGDTAEILFYLLGP